MMARKKSKKKTRKVVKKKSACIKPKRKRRFQTIRGMRDILPEEQPYWQKVRKVVEKVAENYAYQRIDLPLVEDRELFERGTGKDTDIVEKEMYKFKTKGRDDVCLRPEATPSVVRAFIENGMQSKPKPVKLYYVGPMYRHDRPKEGRYREFYQFGFEAIGEQDSVLDAQMIQLALKIVKNLGFKKLSLQLNSIGCSDCRPDYNKLLISYLNNRKASLCMDCKKRLKRNPLRILDCKEDKCVQVISQAPQTIDHLCKDCKQHFTSLMECLDEIEIPYEINPRLVRGLDYYTKTVFEMWSTDDEMGDLALGGGGRYDCLVRKLGGKMTPAIGFAAGIDRIVEGMKKNNASLYKITAPRVYLAQLGDLAKRKSLKIFEELEKSGIGVAESFGRGNLRSQLRQADKLKVDLVLIIGQREALDETVIVKDMISGNQETMPFDRVAKEVKKRLKSVIRK
jgi:histidyl-tRNA synthetase